MNGILKAALFTAAITTAACGGNSSPSSPSPTPPANTSSVSIVAGATTLTTTAYNPNPITVTRGTTVTWKNNDTIPHTSTSDTGAWNSGSMAAGSSFSMTFSTTGTFPYHCAIHPGMVGTVTVQ